MRPNDRYVHALNFSLYVGGSDVIGAQNLGALCIWGGTLPSERLLFILKTYQPTIIWTSPSYAWQLGEKAIKAGYDPKKDFNIQKIIVAGELGGSIDSTRKAIEDIWGAEVFDFYGLSDIFGACAAQCEYHDGLHIAENHILVETVDIHTGEILEPGQTKGITGEYLIRIFEKDFTNKYAVEIEKTSDNTKDDETIAAEVSAALKARIGVKPAKVIVHPDGGLDTRSEHKSRRVIDERTIDYSI